MTPLRYGMLKATRCSCKLGLISEQSNHGKLCWPTVLCPLQAVGTVWVSSIYYLLFFESPPFNLQSPTNTLFSVAMPAEPFVAPYQLRFRGIPDSLAEFHLEASECCLIHIDNPFRNQKKTYVNPQVLVGYSGEAYDAVHPQTLLLSSWRIFKALWENRIRRWVTSPYFKEWRVRRRVREWSAMSKEHEEHGQICLINEMQVLAENGWAHV